MKVIVMFQRSCSNRSSPPAGALCRPGAFAASVAVIPLMLLLGPISHAGGPEAEGEVCSLPPDPGPCDGECPRWFFNAETGKCEMFIWGCCEGNANNFESLKECEAACGDSCPADIDGSGDVGFGDLLSVLSNWGPCPECPQDLDGDNVVGFSDLLILLSAWGPCP